MCGCHFTHERWSARFHWPPSPWPVLPDSHPLYMLYMELGDILRLAGYNEMWGIILKPCTEIGERAEAPDFHTLLILQKFLRANKNNVTSAKQHLQKTLAWRRKFDPVKAMNEVFNKDKFNALPEIEKFRALALDHVRPARIAARHPRAAGRRRHADGRARDLQSPGHPAAR